MTRILQDALAASALLLAAPALACEGPKAPPPNPTSAAACPFLEAQGRKTSPPAHRFEGVRVITASAAPREAPAVAIAN
jgi:hypothetical protein